MRRVEGRFVILVDKVRPRVVTIDVFHDKRVVSGVEFNYRMSDDAVRLQSVGVSDRGGRAKVFVDPNDDGATIAVNVDSLGRLDVADERIDWFFGKEIGATEAFRIALEPVVSLPILVRGRIVGVPDEVEAVTVRIIGERLVRKPNDPVDLVFRVGKGRQFTVPTAQRGPIVVRARVGARSRSWRTKISSGLARLIGARPEPCRAFLKDTDVVDVVVTFE